MVIFKLSFGMTVWLFLALLLAALIPTNRAALPPGAIDALKANATEVLFVLVVAAETEDDSDSALECLVDQDVTAHIISVNTTTQGLTAGSLVEFESYHKTNATACDTFVGPEAPPVLEPGWCGYVYLMPDANDDLLEDGETENDLKVAAYGGSFEAADGTECPNVDDVYTPPPPGESADEGSSSDDASAGVRMAASTIMAVWIGSAFYVVPL